MSDPELGHGIIGVRTALILFAVLSIFAVSTLKGTALAITLLIIGALAVKAILHHLRSRLE